MVAMAPAGLVSPLAVKDLSSKKFFGGNTVSSVFVKNVKARTVCAAAEEKKSFGETAGKVATALALASIVGNAPFAAPENAMADVAGLTPCKESKAFAKREKQEIKKLESRLKLYAEDSAPALAIKSTVEKTRRRFAFYGDAGLLCGTDGLPHLIVDGDQRHLGEFVYPGIVFLYIAGWIGWVGRDYLIAVRSAKKPTEKEIIIDVPLAVSLLWKGAVWPIAAVAALRNGELIEKNSNITVSPR
jgi:photosystem I subunit 3